MAGLDAMSEPSMDEILASIRKIIADDGQGLRLQSENASAPHAAAPSAADADEGAEADDLPAMFRVAAPAIAPERAAPLLNRLADALRGAPAASAPDRALEPARSLEDDLADLLEGPSSGRGAAPVQPSSRVAGPASPADVSAGASANFAMNTPQAKRLLASLDESLARLGVPSAPPEATKDTAAGSASLSVAPPPAASYESSSANPPPAPLGIGAILAEQKAPPAVRAAPSSRPVTPELGTSLPAEAKQSPAIEVKQPEATPAPLAAETKPLQPKPTMATKPADVKPTPAKPAAKRAEAKSVPSEARNALSSNVSVISGAELFIKGVEVKPGALNGVEKSAGSGAATLDNALAELLRPILKQWVDEHMPRMVENIMRAEVAEAFRLAAKAKEANS